MLHHVSFGLGVIISATLMAAEPARLGSAPGVRSSQNPSTDQADSSRESSGERGRIVSPYWDQRAEGDSPAGDIRAVPPARAAAVQARWVHNQLLTDLNIATRMRSLELESKPEYRKAVSEEAAAYDAMQSARAQALSGLNKNDAYIASEQLRSQLTEQIKDLHYDRKPDESRIHAMAKLKLNYVSDNRRLETDALMRDENYQNARKNYTQTAQRVSELRGANALTVAMDQDLISLRRGVAETRIAKLVSQAYLDSTVRARNIAVNYSAFSRNVDRYRPVGYPSYSSGGWYDLGGYYPRSSSYGYR